MVCLCTPCRVWFGASVKLRPTSRPSKGIKTPRVLVRFTIGATTESSRTCPVFKWPPKNRGFSVVSQDYLFLRGPQHKAICPPPRTPTSPRKGPRRTKRKLIKSKAHKVLSSPPKVGRWMGIMFSLLLQREPHKFVAHPPTFAHTQEDGRFLDGLNTVGIPLTHGPQHPPQGAPLAAFAASRSRRTEPPRLAALGSGGPCPAPRALVQASLRLLRAGPGTTKRSASPARAMRCAGHCFVAASTGGLVLRDTWRLGPGLAANWDLSWGILQVFSLE